MDITISRLEEVRNFEARCLCCLQHRGYVGKDTESLSFMIRGSYIQPTNSSIIVLFPHL